MTEEAVVYTVEDSKDLARVTVEPGEACCSCSIRAVCREGSSPQGRLTVLNPVHARPGDKVLIKVPDDVYSHQAVLLFGGLLAAALVGLGLGILASVIFGLSATEAGFAGFSLGLVLGGLAVHRRFRSARRRPPFPVIVEVVKQGDAHGSA